MSDDIKQNMDTSSAEFKEGAQAGPNSAEDEINWQNSKVVGEEPKDQDQKRPPVYESPFKKASTPLFMKYREGNKGNAQDEKDETEE
jgi:hypothetical protein